MENKQIEDVFANLSEANVGNTMENSKISEPVVMTPIQDESVDDETKLSKIVFWAIIVVIVVAGAFFVRMFLK